MTSRKSTRTIAMVLVGRVQSGRGDAARWLSLFNDAYSRKTGMAVFPGSLNVALDAPFDWFAPEIEQRSVWFGREEYGGERDILLVPCVLANLNAERAMLWTPTTAARNRPDPWVVEIIAGVNLRATYGLSDGDVIEIELQGTDLVRLDADISGPAAPAG